MYLSPVELEIIKIIGEWMIILVLTSFFNIFLILHDLTRDATSYMVSRSIDILNIVVSTLFLVSIFVMLFIVYLASTIYGWFLYIIILINVLLIVIEFLFIYRFYIKGR